MKNCIATVFTALVILTIGLLTVSACGQDAPADQAGTDSESARQNTRTVVIEKVRREQLQSRSSYPGTVSAVQTANLAFRISGPLIQVNVAPGDLVSKGQVLLKIDPQDFEDRIRVLQAQLAGGKSQQATAESDFGRMKTLFSQKVIPQADFDHARNAVNTAQANVKTIQAQLAIARHQLEYTKLKAPYDAIITARMIENHEMVAQGHPVLSLHDISMLKIKINLPENEMSTIRLSQDTTARVSFPSQGSQNFNISLKEWKTSADPTTKTYQLTFVMPAPDDALVLPGMTAEVYLGAPDAARSVITVPAKAMVTDDSGRSVLWIFDKSQRTAHKSLIVPGPYSGASRIVIESGLTGDEWIVTQGVNFIVQGEKLSYTTRNDAE